MSKNWSRLPSKTQFNRNFNLIWDTQKVHNNETSKMSNT